MVRHGVYSSIDDTGANLVTAAMATQSSHSDTDNMESDALRKEILWATHKHLLDETITQIEEEKQRLVDVNKELSTENDELRQVNEELREENEELQEVLRQIRQNLESPSESRKPRRLTGVHETEQGQRDGRGQAAALQPARRDAGSPPRQESPVFCEETAQEEEQHDSANHTSSTSQPGSGVARSTLQTPASIKSETDSIIVLTPASRPSPSDQTNSSRNIEDEFDPSITIRLVRGAAQDNDQALYENVVVPDGVKKSVGAVINHAKAQADGKPWIAKLQSTFKCASVKLAGSKNFWVEGSEGQPTVL